MMNRRYTEPLAGRAGWIALLLVAFSGCAALEEAAEPAPPPVALEPTLDIWAAAAAGDLAELAAHAHAGTHLDALDPQVGVTPLVAAIATLQEPAALWLLANGATPDARTGDGGSALIAAAFVGAADLAEALLEAGADPNLRNDGGQTAWDMARLDWQITAQVAAALQLPLEREAVEAGREEILAMLLPRLAQVDVWVAAAAGDVDAVRAQIEAGLDINQRNADSGSTLLSIAALYDHLGLAELLLDAGARVDRTNYDNGATPLHVAAFLGRAEIAALLLDHGADPRALTDEGATPLSATEVGWAQTQALANVLQIEVREGNVKAGREKAAELIRAALSR